MTVEDELGPLTRIYRTNDHRRRKRALILLAVGGASTPPGVGWAVNEYDHIDQANGFGGWAPGLVAALAILVLLLGVFFLVVFSYTRGEKFYLHEHGLARETRTRLEFFRWGDIADVGPIGNGLIEWALGGDTACRISLTTPHEIYITGFTEDAAELRRRIEDGCQS